MMDGSALPQPGDTIAGKYVLERVIGEGGMSVVYGATHRVTGKRFAIKWMLPDVTPTVGETAKRFIREAQVAGLFQHPNVVEVYDVGQVSGSFYMVMEWLDGESLATRLERLGSISFPDMCAFLIPCMNGVTEAHSAGIVHRDLKPANIFLCRAMHHTPERPKVLDFGIAKISKATFDVNSLVTKSGVLIGTPHYLSPEQLRGQPIDHRTDVYAFGVIMYQLLSGKLPFPADNFGQLVLQIATGTPVPLAEIAADLPAGAAEVVSKAMAREQIDRFQSCREIVEALEDSMAGVPLSAASSYASNWAGAAPTVHRSHATPHSGLTYPSVPVKTPPPLPSARAKANSGFPNEGSGPRRERSRFAYENTFDAVERTPSGRPLDSRTPSNGRVPLDARTRKQTPVSEEASFDSRAASSSGSRVSPGRTPTGSWRSDSLLLSAAEAGARLIAPGGRGRVLMYAAVAAVVVGAGLALASVWLMKPSADASEQRARATAPGASKAPAHADARAANGSSPSRTAPPAAAQPAETSMSSATNTPPAPSAPGSSSAPAGVATATDPRVVAPNIAALPVSAAEAQASGVALSPPTAAGSAVAPAAIAPKPKPKLAKPLAAAPAPQPQPPLDLQPAVQLPADPAPAPTSTDALDRNPLHMKLQ